MQLWISCASGQSSHLDVNFVFACELLGGCLCLGLFVLKLVAQ